MADKQNNLVVLTYEEIHDMLKLDNEHKVIGVITSPRGKMYSTIEVIISGPTCLLVQEGTPMPCIHIKDGKVDHG